MISAPCLISSRIPARNSSGPSHMRMPPADGTFHHHEWLSLLCPVVLSSRLAGTRRGPGMMPSSMARFIDGSMSLATPAPIAPVYPQRSAVCRFLAATTAAYAVGSSEPSGVMRDPSSRYAEWKWHVTMPGITVRPPTSCTSSPGCGAGAPWVTEAMRSPSTITVASGEARLLPVEDGCVGQYESAHASDARPNRVEESERRQVRHPQRSEGARRERKVRCRTVEHAGVTQRTLSELRLSRSRACRRSR